MPHHNTHSKSTLSLHTLLLLSLLLLAGSGCQKQYNSIGTGSFSSPTSSTDRSLKGIFWLSENDGPFAAVVWHQTAGASDVGRSFSSGGSMIIHGQQIKVNLETSALYALHSDYTLHVIPLTEDELDDIFSNVFGELENLNKRHQHPTWRNKVRPYIQLVDDPALRL